jgi:hypothetical protein
METRMRTTMILTAAASTLALLACSGGDKPAAKPADKPAAQATEKGASTSQPTSAAPATAAAAPAAGGNEVALTKLALKAEAPAGTEAKDAIVGEGVMLQGPGLIVSVEVSSDTRPKTIEDAKKDAEMYTPKNLKEEKLADGYAISFENEGGMGKNYWVMVRREIGGKAYWCETTASQPEQQENALKACKSLKP